MIVKVERGCWACLERNDMKEFGWREMNPYDDFRNIYMTMRLSKPTGLYSQELILYKIKNKC